MTTSLLERATTSAASRGTSSRPTCQVYAGSLLAPCPNPATATVVRRGAERPVCPAHA
jgi:hypothetical protein